MRWGRGQTGDRANVVQGHTGVVTDIQFAPDETYFITSSKDTTAKVRAVASVDARQWARGRGCTPIAATS